MSEYIELVRKKARGEAWTGAKWIREFVTNHPDYNRDSVISPKVARDLALAAHEVGVGARDAKALTGRVATKPVSAGGAADTPTGPGVEARVHGIDANGDGEIQFNEFVELMMGGNLTL